MSSAELEYPGPWLRAWVDILRLARRGREMPAVEIYDRRPGSKVHGRYVLDDHVVRLYPGEDRAEALCTLLHELAHAWAPSERASHGALWRETYAHLFGWLAGGEIDLVRLPAFAKVVIPSRTGRPIGSGDAVLALALDVFIESQLAALEPTITLESFDHPKCGSLQAISARLGDRRRCTFDVTAADQRRRA